MSEKTNAKEMPNEDKRIEGAPPIMIGGPPGAAQEKLEATEVILSEFCEANELDYVIARKTLIDDPGNPESRSYHIAFYCGPVFDKFGDDTILRMNRARDVLIENLANAQRTLAQLMPAKGIGLAPMAEVARALAQNREMIERLSEIDPEWIQRKVAAAKMAAEQDEEPPTEEESPKKE